MMLQNGFTTHFQASPLISMRTVSQASSQSGRSVDADTWCKRALILHVRKKQFILLLSSQSAKKRAPKSIHQLSVASLSMNVIGTFLRAKTRELIHIVWLAYAQLITWLRLPLGSRMCYASNFMIVISSGRSRISPWWGANPPGVGEPTYDFVKFSPKLHEI